MAVNVPLQTLFANTRAGTVYQTTSAGAIEAVAAETTRTAHWVGGKPHALFEPARTNSIRNSTFTGGTAGVLGSGGVLPTNVAIGGFPAASTTVAFGTEDGFSYMELRLNGTPTANVQVFLETNAGIAASNGQNWTHSVYVKRQAGSQTNITATPVGNLRYTSVPAFHSGNSDVFSITTDRQRLTFTDTSVDDADGTGTIAYIRPYVQLSWTSGAIDITLRFYAPQMELGAFATSPILTSGSAVTRAADNATCSVSTFPIDQNGGSIEIIGRADYTVGGSGFPILFQIDDGTNNNKITFLVSEASGAIGVNVTVGGVSQANEFLSYTSGVEFHVVLTFEEDNVFISIGGSDSTPDTTASFPTGLLTTWRWAQDSAGASNGAAVFINRIASHSHEFSTTAANTITG